MPFKNEKGPEALSNARDVDPADPVHVASSGLSTKVDEMVSGPSEPSPYIATGGVGEVGGVVGTGGGVGTDRVLTVVGVGQPEEQGLGLFCFGVEVGAGVALVVTVAALAVTGARLPIGVGEIEGVVAPQEASMEIRATHIHGGSMLATDALRLLGIE